MVYRPIQDTYHKIEHYPLAEFKIDDIRIISPNNPEENLEIGDDYFLLRVKYSGDRNKAINMIFNELKDIEGEYYSKSYDSICHINA